MSESKSLPSVAPEPMLDSEWNKLLSRIEQGIVIPVIGGGLSVMQLGQPPVETEFGTYLARTLAQQYELPDPPPETLNDLACRCLKEKNRGALDDLNVDIFQAIQNAQTLPLPSPLLKLAEIRGFSLFVSTTFDPYMALALNEVRFGRRSSQSTRILAYEKNKMVDPPKLAEIDHPVLYHLFGKAQASGGFAVTDEDVLEFIRTLQLEDCQPKNLFDALDKGRLLVLGCHFSGWLARFFLRLSSKERRLSEVGRADYLLETSASDYRDQVLFFERFGGAKVLRGSATEFVDELHRRWKQRHPDPPEGAPTFPLNAEVSGDVFLSYASEDRAAAIELRERLERANIRVWLDRDNLRGGDKWESKIAHALDTCTLFVPLISANVKIGRWRFVRTEWEVALNREKGMLKDTKYIVPVVLDDTSDKDPSLPEGLRATQWYRRQDETNMAHFVAELRQVIEKARPR